MEDSEFRTYFEAKITPLQAQWLNTREELFADNNTQTIEFDARSLADRDGDT